MNHTIQITVMPGTPGDFVYTPAVLHIQLTDSVSWTSDLPFTLEFQEGSPFDAQQVFSRPSGLKVFDSARHAVSGPRGQYHYAVAVWSAADQRIYLDAACPRISVN